jgi:hypothetical protein
MEYAPTISSVSCGSGLVDGKRARPKWLGADAMQSSWLTSGSFLVVP